MSSPPGGGCDDPQETAGQPSTKVTVKLSPRTMGALEQASKLVELNKTDTINRGIQVYAYLLAQADPSWSITIMKNGQQEHIRL